MSSNKVFPDPDHPESIATTLSIYSTYCKFLKICGVFPYSFNYETAAANNFKAVVSVSRATKPSIWRFLNLALLSFLALHFIFEFIQFIRIIRRDAGGSGRGGGLPLENDILGISGWLIQGILTFAIVTYFWYNGYDYCSFLTKWNRVEYEILSKYSVKNRAGVEYAISSQKKWHLGLMIGLLCTETLSLILVTLNHYFNPKFPALLFSIVPTDSSAILNTLGYISSITIQLFSTAINRLILSQFELLCLTFAMSIRNCLRIMAPLISSMTAPAPPPQDELRKLGKAKVHNFADKADSPLAVLYNYRTSANMNHLRRKASTIGEAEVALSQYEVLRQDLMREFNAILNWLLFIYKAAVMCQLCVTVFVTVRAIITDSSESEAEPASAVLSALVFMNNTATHVVKLYLMLIPMGSIPTQCVEFVSSWIRTLWQLLDEHEGLRSHAVIDDKAECKIIKQKLKDSCPPMGFQTGCFYIVQPTTILTFFSITTTYLIVMLQI